METQVQSNEPLAIFNTMASRGGLTVGLSVYDFKVKLPDRSQATPEEFQLIEYDQLGMPKGLKPIKFGESGCYEARNPMVVDCLRQHKQNVANGGAAFMEAPKEVLRHGRQLANVLAAEIPDGGLNDADRALLEQLQKYSDEVIPPKAVPKACRRFTEAVTRFHVNGARAPFISDRPGMVRTRVDDLLEILASVGIQPEKSFPGTPDAEFHSAANITEEAANEGRGDT